jgi:hypothetical protein
MGRNTWLLGLATVLLAGCATHYAPDVVNDPYGFFSGIWHGMLFPWALLANVISWFVGLLGFSIFDSIQIVGQPNTGLWYYIGFALGLFAYGGA